MEIFWTVRARQDLERLYVFLDGKSPKAAVRILTALVSAPERIREHPRIGERLEAYEPREVRRLLLQEYEIRYEIRTKGLYVLRIWHAREDR